MSTIYRLDHHGLQVEEFETGLYCNGRAFLWDYQLFPLHDGCQCWGYTVTAPANSYVRVIGSLNYELEHCAETAEYILDDSERCIEVIQVLQMKPLQLECTRYMGLGKTGTRFVSGAAREFEYHTQRLGGADSIVIDSYLGSSGEILVPAEIDGLPVTKVVLDDSSLTENCETLIISDGIERMELDFNAARCLHRLELPNNARFSAPPQQVSFTPWFQEQPREPVYLCSWYCGTPGGGSGSRDLILKEGTVGVAGAADFHCYWHKIHMPDSITAVGNYAFSKCFCLEELHLSSSLQELGEGAFLTCDRLRTLYLPDSLKEPVNSFLLFEGLEEVSLPHTCWDYDADPFLHCPRILVRYEDCTDIITRDNIRPRPINGSISAYPLQTPFLAAGRGYPNLAALMKKREFSVIDYRDCCGNRVRHIWERNPLIYTANGAEYCEDHWYLQGPQGITQITVDDLGKNQLIQDGITLDDVPERLRDFVAPLFDAIRD